MKLFIVSLLALLSSAAAFSSIAPSTSTRADPLSMSAQEPKVILVTGSSRGLGKAIALELGRAGQKVVVNFVSDTSKDAAAATVEEIKQLGGDAFAIQADSKRCENICRSLKSMPLLGVHANRTPSRFFLFQYCNLLVSGADPTQVDKLMETAVEKFGTIDVLINNAGITRDTLVMRMKPEQWQDVININLSGVFYCTKAFFKVASKKRTGRIINISSVVGQIGNPGQANYAAAKGGVLAMTKSNAKEFASRGITVNCICPGFIDTDMTAELSEEYLVRHNFFGSPTLPA